MKDEKIKQLQKQFNNVYLDTIKHCQDIEKWIKLGNRKQGDIRRSLNRLTKKYESLCELKTELGKNHITEQEALNHVSNYKNQVNLAQIKDKMEALYDLAGLKKQTKPIYGKDIELITDIPINMPLFIESSKEKSLTIKIKQKFEKMKDKIQTMVSHFSNSRQKNKKTKGRLAKRIASLAMASSLAFFGSVTTGENTSKLEGIDHHKSYTDTNHEKNDFKDSIYMQALENTEETKVTDTIEKDKSTEDVFLVHANTTYTEVSDGSGNSGYFAKDTKVKLYNRALIKTCEDGSKKILKATKVGQTWQEFAEEKGIDYKEFKEYIENNENIQECVSIQSEDEKTLYGWLSIDELERIEVENMEEIER